MRKAIIPALLLVLVSVVLGATVFREQVANAAATLMVRETNTDAQGNIKVHEQGIANVNVTNSSLTVASGVATKHLVEVVDCDEAQTFDSGAIAASFINLENLGDGVMTV